MEKLFSVGEMVIMQHATYYSEFDGSLAIVEEGECLREYMNLNTMTFEIEKLYCVHILGLPDFYQPKGVLICAAEYQMRKIGDQINCDVDELEFSAI